MTPQCMDIELQTKLILLSLRNPLYHTRTDLLIACLQPILSDLDLLLFRFIYYQYSKQYILRWTMLKHADNQSCLVFWPVHYHLAEPRWFYLAMY